MVWCLLSMILGALIFCAGMMIEQFMTNRPQPSETTEESYAEADPLLFRQWENLLGYDGTKQEGFDDDR